ncbi:hypothetical protein ACQP2Y_12485 [Actinoplanes sp. CA-051413]|uniref:hypothetical protein n=1 Tax=Actinoplanes sp. CA-051413 TaxID=3239899 RepID=UPI003D985186
MDDGTGGGLPLFDFTGGDGQTTIAMTDRDDDGSYRATVTNTSVPEAYTFCVTAFGVTADGVSFRCEGKMETHVLVRPDPVLSTFEVALLQPGLASVQVIPRDRFRNVVLADPATLGGFAVTTSDGQVGPLVSGLDGTYRTTVKFDPKATPTIGFEYGGVGVTDPVRVVPLGELTYPDQVVSYDPGPDRKANRHADPKAALGDVVKKPQDMFVSLGAGGSVVLGVDKKAVVATAHDDVTVFVAADKDLRGYLVEALSKATGKWVKLGESLGTTQAFSLAAGKLKATPAIRVVDTSGRSRDEQLQPLSTPGVSVRGLGVLRTAPATSGILRPWPRSGRATGDTRARPCSICSGRVSTPSTWTAPSGRRRKPPSGPSSGRRRSGSTASPGQGRVRP